MRRVLVCLVVVTLTGPVLAVVSPYSGAIDIRTAGAVQVGDHWEVDVGPGGVLPANSYVDIYVSCTDPVGMSAFQVQLTGPDGLCYAGSGSGGYNPMNSDPRGWQPWPRGCFPPGPIVGAFCDSGWEVPYGFNGWAASVRMLGAAPVGSTFGVINPAIVDHNENSAAPANITVRPLMITPEPASALLLLVGLPLLRRRR